MILLHLINSKPYLISSLNKLELFNESCILLISYTMFVFTDFQEDPGVKFEFGWLFCGAILTTLFVNISTLVYQSVIKPLKKIRKKKSKLLKLRN